MAYKPYRGSGYYGRRRHRIFVLLLLLLLFAAVFMFFYMQEYIVFTADGFRFSFGAQDDETDPSVSDPDTPPDLVIDDPVDPPADNDNPADTDITEPNTPDDEPDAEPAESTHALWVEGPDALDGALPRDPLNALALTVKDFDGLSVLDNTAVSDAVSALLQDGGRAVALASALRDDTAPRNDIEVAVRTGSGARWLDYDYVSWLNPYSEGTADVLIALAQACYDAGFEELVLQNFQFPTVGRTELISYGDQAESRTEALTALLAAVREGAPEGLAISVVLTDEAAASLQDESAGQDAALLAEHCAHLYVQTGDPAFDLTALTDAVSGTGCVPALLLSGSQAPESVENYILVP